MANEFKPTVGAPISVKEAKERIEKFKKERKKDTDSVFFGRDVIQGILADARAAGISMMFCRKYDDKQKKDIDDIILVGRMEDGTLLWDETQPLSTTETNGPIDGSLTCPPTCA
ncbi:MAG TPA: hypothetical protein VD927_07785 [Chryseosolibacter sp.]|nr:hypothetical protein [Chryseosolibacter sp.]